MALARLGRCGEAWQNFGDRGRRTGEAHHDQKPTKTKPSIYAMSFARVYLMYVKKAERKGRTKAEVEEIVLWLTGHTPKSLGESASLEALGRDTSWETRPGSIWSRRRFPIAFARRLSAFLPRGGWASPWAVWYAARVRSKAQRAAPLMARMRSLLKNGDWLRASPRLTHRASRPTSLVPVPVLHCPLFQQKLAPTPAHRQSPLR